MESIEKLSDPVELVKLHFKHNHMSSSQLRWRTNNIGIPKNIHDLYDTVVKKCKACQKVLKAIPILKIAGLRVEVFDYMNLSSVIFPWCSRVLWNTVSLVPLIYVRLSRSVIRPTTKVRRRIRECVATCLMTCRAHRSRTDVIPHPQT